MAQPSTQPQIPPPRYPQGYIQPNVPPHPGVISPCTVASPPPSKTQQTFLCHPVPLASTSPTLPLGTLEEIRAGPGCDGGTSALPGGRRARSAATEALHLPGWSQKPTVFSFTALPRPSASNDPSRPHLKGRRCLPISSPHLPHSLPGLSNSQNRVCSSYLFGLLATGHVEMLQSGVGRCPQPGFSL